MFSYSELEVDNALSNELYIKMRTLPLTSPKGGSKSEFSVFVNNIQVQSNNVCYKFRCVKTSSGKVVVEPFPYLMVCRRWQ